MCKCLEDEIILNIRYEFNKYEVVGKVFYIRLNDTEYYTFSYNIISKFFKYGKFVEKICDCCYCTSVYFYRDNNVLDCRIEINADEFSNIWLICGSDEY